MRFFILLSSAILVSSFTFDGTKSGLLPNKAIRTQPSPLQYLNRRQTTRTAVLPPIQSALTAYADPRPSLFSSLWHLKTAVQREIQLTYGVLESDLPATVCLGSWSAIAFGLARSSPPLGFEWALVLTKCFIWFTAYAYTFTIGNQIAGVEEDKLNCESQPSKKNRPLASGALSLSGAFTRYLVSGVSYLGISYLFGGLKLTKWALLWVLTSHLQNFHGFGDHFMTKNYFAMSSGSATLLLGARILAGEAQSSIVPPLLTAIWVGLCMDVQDFRDEEGDRSVGRKTTSVLWGVPAARRRWAAMVSLVSSSFVFGLRRCLSVRPDALLLAGLAALVIHTLQNKTAEEDNFSYQTFVMVFTGLFMRSAFWAASF